MNLSSFSKLSESLNYKLTFSQFYELDADAGC